MGLFNSYLKEGPGISKNAPKKRTFVVFFETFFRNFWKLGVISIVYSLVCIPVITAGLGNVGFTHVARNTARDKHSFGLSDFFETVKKNWKQALGVGIINIIVYGLLFFNLWYFYLSEGTVASIGLGITLSLLFIYTVMNFFFWTLIITFSFSTKQIIKNSFKFTFINLKMNLLCMLILGIALALYVGMGLLLASVIHWALAVTLVLFLYIFTYPTFKFLLVQYCTFPSVIKYIIAPYYEEHPDDDIEKRRDLGLPVPEDEVNEEDTDEDNEENVFND